MAINSFQIEDVVDKRTGEVRRRMKVKLADRNVALCTLSKCLGMQTDRVLLEASVEYRVTSVEYRIKSIRSGWLAFASCARKLVANTFQDISR